MKKAKTNQVEFLTGLKGVVELFPNKIEKGNVAISPFTFSEAKDSLFNLRAVRDGGYMFKMYDGRYVRLNIDGKMTMSDTAMERYSNREVVKKAHGRVLIAGLGLGLIIHNITNKPGVKEVLVVELNKHLIDIVWPKIACPEKLKVIQGDIFNWTPPRGKKFNVIYFDIWPTIDTDNLAEIKTLHNKFKSSLDRQDPDCYMNSWMKEFLQKRQRTELRETRNNYW